MHRDSVTLKHIAELPTKGQPISPDHVVSRTVSLHFDGARQHVIV